MLSPDRRPRLRSVVAHPPRLGSAVDKEGFHIVESKRRWRRHPRPAPTGPRPVPAALVGLCFNCLASDRVAARCRLPSRCLFCKGTGHQAKDCKRPRSSDRATRPLPPRSGRPVRPRTNEDQPRSSSSDANTVSGRYCSTGRETSVPPACTGSPRGPAPPLTPPPSPPPSPLLGAALRRSASAIVVIPRTPEINAAEDALSLALVATVEGVRPAVSLRDVRQQLESAYHLAPEEFVVHRHAPEDSIVRFRALDALLDVLHALTPISTPFSLVWRRWRRESMASAGSFRFKVLIAMTGILGYSCTKVEEAPPSEDSREYLVAAWCMHPDFVPQEVIVAVPEPEVPFVVEPPLYLREHEISGHCGTWFAFASSRCRIGTPPSSPDGASPDDSDDSNDPRRRQWRRRRCRRGGATGGGHQSHAWALDTAPHSGHSRHSKLAVSSVQFKRQSKLLWSKSSQAIA